MKANSLEKQYLDIYNKHANDIFRYIYYRVYNYELAKDLTQEAFTRCWQYIISDNKVEKMKSLLYKIARNLIIDQHRKKANYEASLEALQEQGKAFSDQYSNQEKIRDQIDAEILLAEIQNLESDYREVLFLRYVQDLKPREIAEIVGESSNAVSVRINRARKQIRNILEKKNEKNV